jgi:DNA-binding LacI/PurR family transcriptional regulator
MSSSPVALEDIAKSLGIAVSTVSRALRELPGIHPATRARIVQQAESMGYVAPRKRKEETPHPRNILLLTLGADGAPPGYLAGMSRVAPSFNFSLQSHVSSLEDSWNVLDPKYQPPSLKMGLVAGIILIYKWPEEIVLALSRKCPTVSIVLHYPELPIDVIGIDHLSGMFPLVKHLQKTGHERIGFFGLRADISWVRSRFAAYAEALVTYGLPIDFDNVVSIRDPQTIVTFPLLDQAAFEEVLRKIDGGVRAWVCANDVTGNSLCAALLKRGIRIPEDVSVTGFHRRQYPWAHLPQLTTTEVKDDLIGEAALRRMAYRLDHPTEVHRLILMPCKFSQGETTAKLASADDKPTLVAEVPAHS